MTLKNLAIAGLTATAVLFLTAVFFLGFHIWLSPAGVGLVVVITVIAFSGAAFSLRRQNAIPSGSENVVSSSLPGWVRTWQRVGLLLLVLLLLTFFIFK
jgi:hypothetical protein